MIFTSLSLSVHGNARYMIPTDSKKFPIVKPAQFMTWVTLLATTNSMSYDEKWIRLKCKIESYVYSFFNKKIT